MRRLFIALILAALSFVVSAQEPENNLGRTLQQMLIEFPNAKYDKPMSAGGDLWIDTYEDEEDIYTYYFVIKYNRVEYEMLNILPIVDIPDAGYINFLSLVEKFYVKKGWQLCDVDRSILHAISVFRINDRIVWSGEYTAKFGYSNFGIIIEYDFDLDMVNIHYLKK